MREFPTQTQPNHHVQQPAVSENYFSELSEKLETISRATTHYQTLMVKQSATYEEVVLAYKNVVSLLYPAGDLRSALPGTSLGEVEKAFRKVSAAFSTLVEPEKRTAYDHVLLSMYTDTGALISPEATEFQPAKDGLTAEPPVQKKAPAVATQALTSEKSSAKNTGSLPQALTMDLAFSVTSSNRRRNQRSSSCLPVKVGGTGRNFEKWMEETESLDVSKTGVSFSLRKRVRSGSIVKISLPLPEKFRPHGHTKATFNSYALVRRVDPPLKGVRTVAVEFIGTHPPPGYEERPWAVFKPKSWSGQERRRLKREERREKVRLEYYNTAFHLIMKEDTLTENVSEAGMRVVARFVPDEFEFVKIICLERSFENLAIVRSRFLTKDGMERLSLQFLNREKSRL